MKLLFKRNQTTGRVGKVKFQLWGKVMLEEDERAIIDRYRFDDAILIEAVQPKLIRNAVLIGLGVVLVLSAVLASILGGTGGFALGVIGGVCVGYLYFHQKRETIYVRDLLYGRYFSCPSIVELAHKEAWLGVVTSFLRQVMESARHWDGMETLDIEALPKDEAKLVMIRGL